MSLNFQGGIRLREFLNTKKLPVTLLDRPAKVTLAMDNGLTPLVESGDTVVRYQPVAVNDDGFTVSAPISGSVIGSDGKYICIQNDMLSLKAESDANRPSSIDGIDFESLVEYSKKYGVTGAFSGIPLYKKLIAAYGKCERLIISCIESDPVSGHVRANARDNAHELVLGIKVLLAGMGVKKAVIATDTKDNDTRSAISKELDKRANAVFASIVMKYPLGCDKLIVNTIYKTETPATAEVYERGYPVFSAETVIEFYRSLRDGYPVIYKTLTASGNAVIKPMNFKVPIGSPISDLFTECELTSKTKCVYALNGTLNGTVCTETAFIGRNTNTVLAEKSKPFRVGNCIKCARCTSVCPMHLVPFKFHENHESGDHDDNVKLGLYNCIECGSCAFVCVGKVDLLSEIRAEKHNAPTLTEEQASSDTVVFDPIKTHDIQITEESTETEPSEEEIAPTSDDSSDEVSETASETEAESDETALTEETEKNNDK